MRKIILLLDHECPAGYFKAGEEIEVSVAEYEYLMKVYLENRKQEVELEHAAQKVLDRISRTLEND